SRSHEAPVGADDTGPPLEQLGRQARRYFGYKRTELRRCCDRGRRVAAEQQLEGAQRLLVRELNLAKAVPVPLQVDARGSDVQLAADSTLESLVGELEELGCGIDHLAGQLA